jgi:hypothetical protein
MEIFVLFLVILVFASIIGISMISFKLAFTSLLKINLLEQELIEIKNKNKK